MTRRCVSRALIVAGLTALSLQAVAAEAQAEDAATEQRFLQGLWERGYFGLARDYIDQLRRDPQAPAALKASLDYEEARGLAEEAAATADLDQRAQRLDAARARLESFLKTHSDSDQTAEAQVQLGRVLMERGHLAMLLAGDAKNSAETQGRLAEARDRFGEARRTYDQAVARLQADFEKLPRILDESDPRHEERQRAHDALMEAQLPRALVDYEEAQAHPEGSKPRDELLDRAAKAFEDLYQRYRDWMAGQYARMWQAKCFEERGDLSAAMGIYNELMDQPAENLRSLQRQVGYFRIIVERKRGEIALAADDAVRWLQFGRDLRPSDPDYELKLGVELELARNLLAQINDQTPRGDREAATKRAVDLLNDVVHDVSRYKPEALALLRQARPSEDAGPGPVAAGLNFDEAVSQAEAAMGAEQWDRAIALLRAATSRADADRNLDRLNRARYYLTFCLYQARRFYEADVLAEHVARHYPQNDVAPFTADLGMNALAAAYNTYSRLDPNSDLNRLIDLSSYTAQTWPDTAQGDQARFNLGVIALGQGRFAEAAQHFEAVRATSPKHLDALSQAGAAHWRQSLALRQQEGQTTQADEQAQLARERLETALTERRSAGATVSDAGLLRTAADLAEVHLAQDRPQEALDLLTPLTQQLSEQKPGADLAALVARLFSAQLRAHIATGQTEQAIGDMKALEAAGGSGPMLTQLYFSLGQLLEKEMQGLQERGEQKALEKTRADYRKFLDALVESQSGQSYESLQWAGEAMLSLDAPEAAAQVFDRVLNTYDLDPAFKKSPNSATKLARTRLKLAAAYREAKKFDSAESTLKVLLEQTPPLLEALVEQAQLAEAQAAAGQSTWPVALEQWRRLALRLQRVSPRPPQYYEAWYHVAYALLQQGEKQKAIQALKSVMVLSPSVGGPEMKAKYQELLTKIAK